MLAFSGWWPVSATRRTACFLRKNARSCSVAQLGAMKNLASQVFFPALRARAHIPRVCRRNADRLRWSSQQKSGVPHSSPHSFLLTLPVSTCKSIRRMRSVQDSVLPQGVGLRKPHISLFTLSTFSLLIPPFSFPSSPFSLLSPLLSPLFFLLPLFLFLLLKTKKPSVFDRGRRG